MSKTYFGRCAAVGIAGLTAMSSIAIVASAETQASMLYELKYNGIASISMKGNTTYGNGNEYCNPDSITNTMPGDTTNNLMMNGGFVTTLKDLFKVTGSYDVISGGVVASTKYLTSDGTQIGTPNVWTATNFTNAGITSFSTDKWDYKAYGEIAVAGTGKVVLKDPYGSRGVATNMVFTFLNEADRTAAKNTMISKIKSEYTTLANSANAQFRADINAVKDAILSAAAEEKQQSINTAERTYSTSSQTSADAQIRSDSIATANNKYNAIYNAVTTSASMIISEFSQTFNVNNFVYDYKSGTPSDDTFGEAKCPVTYTGTVGGLSGVGTATYTSTLGTAIDLKTAMYNASGNVYNNAVDYVFKGELHPYAAITGSQLVGNGTWKNYQLIDNTANSGGNTSSSGSTNNNNTTTGNTTTTTTTWYPDSAAYRAASDVSYLGKNGSWYTSASAASLYGGGYTGTSKSSNYSSVNSSAGGKAIYFDSASGAYTTSATTYSYVVKEASSTTNDDPYYTYIFGNKNNNTTTTTVPAGSPAINGASKYAGWTNISYYITNKAKSGASYTINMNDGTIVPAAVLAAAKTKNVTLTFANDNGSKITVKPGKVSTTSDLDVEVKYNVKDVKTSLVNKAKKINAGTVSTAQVRIGEDGSLGGTVTANVKFSTKRAGCTVKAYRLSESGSLVKQATGTVSSTGRVNLNLTKGGSYLLVVIDD